MGLASQMQFMCLVSGVHCFCEISVAFWKVPYLVAKGLLQDRGSTCLLNPKETKCIARNKKR